MKIPEMVVGFKSFEVEQEHEEYCEMVNAFIRDMATTYGVRVNSGSFSGDVYVYQDTNFKLSYSDSDYGNDHFQLEVHRSVWDNIPSSLNSFMINEGGPWNHVYHFQGGRDVLLSHLPGSWVNIIRQYYN